MVPGGIGLHISQSQTASSSAAVSRASPTAAGEVIATTAGREDSARYELDLEVFYKLVGWNKACSVTNLFIM